MKDSNCLFSSMIHSGFCNSSKCRCNAFVERTPIGQVKILSQERKDEQKKD